jgi:hypothetical protein
MTCKDFDFKDSICSLQNSPSIDEWITAALRGKGEQTLDALGSLLPETNWAQLFLAVDRLSRAKKIRIRQTSDHDYVLSLAAIMAESMAAPQPLDPPGSRAFGTDVLDSLPIIVVDRDLAVAVLPLDQPEDPRAEERETFPSGI